MQGKFQKGCKILPLPFFMLFFWGMVWAQNGSNPFELVPRAGTKTSVKAPSPKVADTASIDTLAAEAEPAVSDSDANPFALAPAYEGKVRPQKKKRTALVPSTSSNEVDQVEERVTTPSVGTSIDSKRFVFSAIILDLIMVAILLTLLRNFFQKSLAAFSNDNLLNQVFRERQAGTLVPFLFFYFLFFYNLALFLFLLMGHYGIEVKQSAFFTFLYVLAGVITAFLGKHILLRVVGYIFPVDTELRKYSFTIMIFAIISGFFLLLVNLLIAYGPDFMTQYVVWFSFGIIILIYLFRSLRGVFIANKYFWFYKFHFLLYICTVEIAPVLVLAKLIIKQLEG